MTHPLTKRLAHLEAAHLDLLDRVQVLERALEFEVAQREAMEAALVMLTGLPCRVDRLERAAIAGRRSKAA